MFISIKMFLQIVSKNTRKYKCMNNIIIIIIIIITYQMMPHQGGDWLSLESQTDCSSLSK